MEDVEHLELSPSLLHFYRSKINELQKDHTTGLVERFKLVELSAQERRTLERELWEYEEELDQTQQDVDHLRNALVRERRAVIQLVEENAQLRGPHSLQENPESNLQNVVETTTIRCRRRTD